ncbi:Protein lifeguard 1 [Babesia sp. Xinjiang]|uniref:Protein lifeguard 1 n=1 Tax=Babesia sp. Xinjiang TaxID=462227 RepID=UPI000A24C080|nr:Protein lifeguard 1 [Babesia sp. Xinjiang]ORM40385.1 Protein lifeguard 1 [Babesia sp. Xinjiang]
MATTADGRADAANYYDPEKNATGDHYCFSETTPTYIRHEFVKKVFAIVTLQLCATFGFLVLSYNVTAMNTFFRHNAFIGLIAVIIFAIISIVISCKRSLAHNKTVATSLLGVMTVCMALYVTCFAVHYAGFEICVAAGITAGLTFAITLFAFQTTYDFTGLIMYVFCITIAMMFAGILIMIFPSHTARIFYSAVGAVLVCIYLVIDIQLAVGGKNYEWTVDDYVIAAVAIYSDIINLFIHILRILGNASD